LSQASRNNSFNVKVFLLLLPIIIEEINKNLSTHMNLPPATNYHDIKTHSPRKSFNRGSHPLVIPHVYNIGIKQGWPNG